MRSPKSAFALVTILALLTVLGCKLGNRSSSTTSTNSNKDAEATETGIEKIKPSPGTGNVQGKVFYNSKPAANIEVKLCESFNRFLGGCGDKAYTAKTDSDGDFVVTNVPPKTYEALLVRVFDTDTWIFATSGIAGISAAKYEVTADKTLFAKSTHLFKTDLKLLSPKAAEKIATETPELKWESYPDAAYYKLSVNPNDHLVTAPYVNKRVDGTTFSVDQPLQKGVYRWKVEAYNSDNRKLAESGDDIEFTVE